MGKKTDRPVVLDIVWISLFVEDNYFCLVPTLWNYAILPLSAALWNWCSISSADPSFLWNTSFIVPLTLAVWHMSIDLMPLWAAEWTESDKHIKLIGLMTITMLKNNSDQTKGKPWKESVKSVWIHLYYRNKTWWETWQYQTTCGWQIKMSR